MDGLLRLLAGRAPPESGHLDRLWRYTGVAGIAAALVGIAGALAVAPWFTWTGSDLSDLGDPAHASAPLFNGGLVLAGLLGGAFGVYLLRSAEGTTERAGVAILTAAMADLALVGVFEITHPWHYPVSVAFFAGITSGWFVHGSGTVLAGNGRRGVAVVCIGVVHTVAWLGWLAVGTDGLAVPETVGALLLAVWVLDATGRTGPGAVPGDS